MKSVFIDGQVGTTGLQIHERLKDRSDITLVTIEEALRKDVARKKEILNSVDMVILCLPDDAAKESVALIENTTTRVVDASTAHRTNPAWVYGFAELNKGQHDAIAKAQFVANPGCHATGFIATIAPLVQAQIAPKEYPYSVTSISGYSGGGKQMIARYEEAPQNEMAMLSARPYAFALKHKHIPEMVALTGISHAPAFFPMVANFERGMIVSVALENRLMGKNVEAQDMHALLADHYAGSRFVTVRPFDDQSELDGGFLNATALNGTNNLEIFVYGHADQTLLLARFDNLGKGASGAAIQNMNIMLGLDEAMGL